MDEERKVHLVHGMGLTMEAPTWPAITMAEAQSVLAAYPDAGALLDLGWHSPRPFSAAALVRTDRGEFFLKRHHPVLRSINALAEEHRFMAHLRAKGVSVPSVLATETGETALAHDGWRYELHGASVGFDLYRDRLSWTPFLSVDQAWEAGAAMAHMHIAAQDFDAPLRGPYPLISSFTILPAPDPLAAAERYIASRPALAAYFADKAWRSELARIFTLWDAGSDAGLGERLRAQPLLWTHNDWHPSNLLWTKEGKVASIIDFGLATQTCAIHDIATALERFAIPWLNLQDERPNSAAALAFLAGYQQVAPLSREDVDLILRLLPLVHIEFALSEVDYFAGIVKDDAQAALAWDGYAIGHADWFMTDAGQGALHQIRRELSAA